MSISTVEIRAYSGPDLVELQGVNRPAIVRLNVGPKGDDGAAATVSAGTTTTGAAGTNASVTNSGTSSAAVFNFTIPRGDTGAAGPNSVTSTTTSDGTATLSLSTLTVGSAATFNNTSWTYGTGAASAHKTALAIASGDVNFNSAIAISGADSTLSTSGENATIFTNGASAFIYTDGASAFIYTDGANANIYTSGANANIYTNGESANIYTSGGNANIYTSGADAYIQTRSTFKLSNGTHITTLSHAPTANRAIAFPNASGTIALTSDIPPQEVKSANFTAADKGAYVSVATLTVTDPAPSEGASFSVLVRNGTATVGGTAYAVAGTLIRRVFHSGAWANYPYSSALFGTNVATFLQTPNSTNLAAVITDETGSGSLVFGTSPTLTTPTISGIMALSYSNNAFANGLTVRNTSTGTNSLSGITVQDSGGTNVGYMQYCPSNFVNVGLQNTVIFGSIGTQRVGFVANAGGNVGQDVYFKNHSQQTLATIFCQGSTLNVGIGTETPNAKALLDVSSTTKGFLPPRMTTAQRDAITSVPAGLMIYNTSTNKVNEYNGSAWDELATVTETAYAIGNSGTAITIDLANGTFQSVTMTGNCTFTMPTATAGRSFTLRVGTGTGGFTGTFTGVKWSGGVAPTLTSTASRLDILAFVADGTNWYGVASQNFTP